MRFDPEHAVEDLPVILRRPARARLLRRQQRGDLLPLRVSQFESLTVTEKAMPLRGTHSAGPVKPIDVPKSKVLIGGTQIGLGLQTAAIACVMSERGRSSIGVANRIDTVWSMARHAAATLPEFARKPDEVRLVQDYLRTEVSADFELIATLEHGVGVHHAGLSDEIRTLMEWLAEAGHLRVCVQPRPSRKASISPFRPYSRHRVTFRKMDARSRCLRASSGI